MCIECSERPRCRKLLRCWRCHYACLSPEQKAKRSEASKSWRRRHHIKTVHRVEDRICDQCSKVYRGELFGGDPVCLACRTTPGQKAAKYRRNKARKILRRGDRVDNDSGLCWQTLWDEGQRYCAYCLIECDPQDRAYGSAGPTYPTLDHVVALVAGGKHNRANAVLACMDCNVKKGSKAWEEVAS